MADQRMIAQLADLPTFEQLRVEFEERRTVAIEKLGMKCFLVPDSHEQVEWERLKAYYQGVADALALPAKLRDQLMSERKESQ